MKVPIKEAAIFCLLLAGGCSNTLADYGDETVCEVHEQALKIDTVPIVYGLRRFTRAELDASRTLFPHANTVYGGGGMVQPETKAKVKYCLQCRVAEKKWEQENPQPNDEPRY